MPSDSERADEMHRVAGGGLGAGSGERRQLAGCNHLGEHHRRRLQRLFFFFGVGAPRAVLHDQHAERVAGAQDRHAEERVIDFFAGFRAVGEGRMRLRVRQVYRVGFAGDQADQAFVGFSTVWWTASRLRPSVAYSSSVPSTRKT